MSKRGFVEFLSDIMEAITRIQKYVENLNYEQFIQDKKNSRCCRPEF